MDDKSKWQDKFIYKHINGLSWCSGDTDYNEILNILSNYKHSRIYVKGEQKMVFIRKYIPQTDIINLETIPNLNSLRQFKVYCKIHGQIPILRCAVQNCINIYLYMLINKCIK